MTIYVDVSSMTRMKNALSFTDREKVTLIALLASCSSVLLFMRVTVASIFTKIGEAWFSILSFLTQFQWYPSLGKAKRGKITNLLCLTKYMSSACEKRFDPSDYKRTYPLINIINNQFIFILFFLYPLIYLFNTYYL